MPLRIKAANKILAVDWDARAIRLVAVRAKGESFEVLKAASVPVGADVRVDEAPAFGRFLRDVLDQADIRFRKVVLSIPREKVVLNTITVPPAPDDDLPAIVRLQMVKELPFSPDDATMDFAAPTGDATTSRSVLVAAVRNEDLQHCRDIASEAGLTLERVGLRPYANLLAIAPDQSVSRAPGKAGAAAAQTPSKDHVLVIDVGPEMTEIDIVAEGRLLFSRAASARLPNELLERRGTVSRIDDSRIFGRPIADVEAQDVVVKAAIDELLLDEVTRSIEAYRATVAGGQIDRIVIAGATGVEGALAQALKAKLGIEADLFNPARILDLSPARARELRGFSAALGLAMSHGRSGLTQIDFLQPKRPVTARARQMKKMPMAVAAALVFLVAGYWGRYKVLAGAQDQSASLDRTISDMESRLDDLKNFEKRFKPVQAWVGVERIWLDDMLALTQVFPKNEDAYVTKLHLRDTVGKAPGWIDIELRAADREVSLGIVNELNAGDLFRADAGESDPAPGDDLMEFTEDMTIRYKTPAAAATQAPPGGKTLPAKASTGDAGTVTTQPAEETPSDEEAADADELGTDAVDETEDAPEDFEEVGMDDELDEDSEAGDGESDDAEARPGTSARTSRSTTRPAPGDSEDDLDPADEDALESAGDDKVKSHSPPPRGLLRGGASNARDDEKRSHAGRARPGVSNRSVTPSRSTNSSQVRKSPASRPTRRIPAARPPVRHQAKHTTPEKGDS